MRGAVSGGVIRHSSSVRSGLNSDVISCSCNVRGGVSGVVVSHTSTDIGESKWRCN